MCYITGANDIQCLNKITANDGNSYDNFGWSVAISNNIIVVGSPYADDQGASAGSAYVFQMNNSTMEWHQTTELIVNDSDGFDYFGHSVAVSDNIIVVGAPGADVHSGSVYIFEKNSSTMDWYETTKLVANDAADYDRFGHSVAVSHNVIVVGAIRDDDQGTSSGSAYVFEKNSSTFEWHQVTKLIGNDTNAYDSFGVSVSVSNNVIVVGVPGHDDDLGSAYVFEKKNNTTEWYQTWKLGDNDAHRFGSSVVVSNDIIVVGAPADGMWGFSDAEPGRGYIFKKNSSTTEWYLITKFMANDATSSDYFGYSVAVSNNVVVAGAYGTDSNTGSGYIFPVDNVIMNLEQQNNVLASKNNTLLEIYCGIGEINSVSTCGNVTLNNDDSDTINVLVNSNSCFEITVSQCEEDVSYSNSGQSNIVNHRYYTIYIDNITTIMDDYYGISNTHIICPLKNHILFCVYTSRYCVNNGNLLTFQADTVSMKSYQSIVNSGFDTINSKNLVHLDCAASYSCINNNFTFIQDVIIGCGGAFSCVDSVVDIEDGGRVDCYGFGSCNSIKSMTDINLYGLQSISNIIVGNGSDDAFIFINSSAYSYSDTIVISGESSFTAMNTHISLAAEDVDVQITEDYFVFYNVSMSCDDSIMLSCNIRCSDNKTQFLLLDENCNDICIIDSQCLLAVDIDQVLNNIAKDNSNTTTEPVITRIARDISLLSEQFNNDYDSKCDISNSNSIIFNIGAVLKSDDDIINSIRNGIICCRGFESCAYTTSITTDLGSILCIAEAACAQSKLIYTGDEDSSNNRSVSINIYCMGYGSCYGSTLRTTNSILCGTYRACLNSLIMSSKKAYCLKFSCTDATFLAVDEIYIVNSQNGLNVFSGDKSETSIYFEGKNSGSNVYYKCEANSKCYIYCGNDACSNDTTLLVCDGKCFVTCNGIYGNTGCVDIVSSTEPTVAPSPPATSNALTEKDVSVWFNWTLGCGGAFILILLITSFADAKKYHKNDLLHWNYLVVFALYTIDFVSGICLFIINIV